MSPLSCLPPLHALWNPVRTPAREWGITNGNIKPIGPSIKGKVEPGDPAGRSRNPQVSTALSFLWRPARVNHPDAVQRVSSGTDLKNHFLKKIFLDKIKPLIVNNSTD
jgi:hypothetical protein